MQSHLQSHQGRGEGTEVMHLTTPTLVNHPPVTMQIQTTGWGRGERNKVKTVALARRPHPVDRLLTSLFTFQQTCLCLRCLRPNRLVNVNLMIETVSSWCYSLITQIPKQIRGRKIGLFKADESCLEVDVRCSCSPVLSDSLSVILSCEQMDRM